jgi:hypothetical protein
MALVEENNSGINVLRPIVLLQQPQGKCGECGVVGGCAAGIEAEGVEKGVACTFTSVNCLAFLPDSQKEQDVVSVLYQKAYAEYCGM